MQSEDQYLDRTPDLVAKVRAMREAADREMDRFTCVADYDVRRIVGHGPKAPPVSPAVERPKRSVAKSAPAQTSIEFAPAPAERADDGEGA
ncbi:hypothetical protein HNQ77_004732 [Silvibacterium bohemicum]|uniref:Uncharacterized protein n=1 Tax=Silvibacterium bohemicum TaxID=1577686 RepID=A0A841K6I4_9BACT|nr:hypothetical protein [Silvibacterium bohemicum]MBB6146751.1 hypothetical protein [Silvibacterium bohemicum]